MHQPNRSSHPSAQDLDQSTEDPAPPRRRNFTGQLSVPQLPGAMERVSRQRLEELEYSNHLGHTQQTPNPYVGTDPASRPRYRDTSRPWPGQPQSDLSSIQHPQHYQFTPHYSSPAYQGPGIASTPNSASRATFPYGGPVGVRSSQACDACRKRKVRCSLVQADDPTALSAQSPTEKLCVRCSRLNIPCIWKDERRGKTKTGQGSQDPSDGLPEQSMSVDTSASYSKVYAPSDSPVTSASTSSTPPTQGWSSSPNFNPSYPNASSPNPSRGNYAASNTQPSLPNNPSPQNLHSFYSNPSFPRSSTPTPTSIPAFHQATLRRDRADSMSAVDEATFLPRSAHVAPGTYTPGAYSYSPYGDQEDTDQMAHDVSQQSQSTHQMQQRLHFQHHPQQQQPQQLPQEQYPHSQSHRQHPQYPQQQQPPYHPPHS